MIKTDWMILERPHLGSVSGSADVRRLSGCLCPILRFALFRDVETGTRQRKVSAAKASGQNSDTLGRIYYMQLNSQICRDGSPGPKPENSKRGFLLNPVEGYKRLYLGTLLVRLTLAHTRADLVSKFEAASSSSRLRRRRLQSRPSRWDPRLLLLPRERTWYFPITYCARTDSQKGTLTSFLFNRGFCLCSEAIDLGEIRTAGEFSDLVTEDRVVIE
ncbi:hypothetical protein H6P81_007643 [Aristolochia fimbriata]|uniref:Uncharacterized protein n=1 Tax=Aristolochia fimbriata TaxID=158543 RepID=A0AAV7F1G7_ARIFI|nr:hypothetical protein H6P81_007643 [Aristolochia fimbriata]